MDSVPHDTPPSSADNPWPNCGLLLSSSKFESILTPLKKPNFSPPPNILAIGDHIHTSLLSASHKCLRFLHSLASENPLLAKALSLHREYRTFCHQIRCRNKAESFPGHCFAAVLPGDSVAGLVVANGINNFLNLYNTVLLVRLVLTWFPNAPPAIVSPLSTICDPYLNIFRGLIPPLGGTLDLSPILAFLVLNAFTSTAAALPAELPTEQNQPISESPKSFFGLSASQQKWMRRLQARNMTKGSSEEN